MSRRKNVNFEQQLTDFQNLLGTRHKVRCKAAGHCSWPGQQAKLTAGLGQCRKSRS